MENKRGAVNTPGFDVITLTKITPLKPDEAMIVAGAESLVSWGESPDCKFPESFSSLDVRAARNDAEKCWRSMWIASPVNEPTAAGVTEEMVNRFLNWPLPASVCADLCATLQAVPNRYGTNLLTATEAWKMLTHVLSLAQPIADTQAALNVCNCAEISDAIENGHPNPEGAYEWKDIHGHFKNCPVSDQPIAARQSKINVGDGNDATSQAESTAGAATLSDKEINFIWQDNACRGESIKSVFAQAKAYNALVNKKEKK